MSLLLHLYLIHFIADYPLQPNKLVALKKKGYAGVFLHCLVHLITLIVLLMPFLEMIEVWIGIAIVFGTHNIIDQTKVWLDKKYPSKDIFLYFADQTAHLTVLTGVAYYVGRVFLPEKWTFLSVYYQDTSFVLYFLMIVLATYFYDVTRYFILRHKHPGPYSRDYRTMFLNVFIVSLGFVIYWIF